jgi:hypothetical protein
LAEFTDLATPAARSVATPYNRALSEPMNDEPIFTADGAWTDGHYELLLDVGSGVPAPDQVAAAAAALWAHPHLDGPCSRCDIEPGRQARSDPGSARCYGTATLADGVLVPCASWTLSSIPDFLPDGEPHPPDAAHIHARARFKLAVTDFEPDVKYDLWRSWADGAVPVPAERPIDLHLASGSGLERFRRAVWV